MKNSIKIIIIVIELLIGLTITLYPIISSAYNSKHQSEIHTQYIAEIEKTDNSQIAEVRDAAKAYNAAITPGISVYNPEMLAQISEGYDEQLNLTGDGIMGYVEIPVINVNLPIYHGTDSETLETGVGHLLGSSLPVGGDSTHAVLTAHSGMASQKLFSDLDKMKVGDTFYLHILDEVLAYQVDEINVVLPHDTKHLGITVDEDLCTLITCTPFAVNTHRLLVRGTRIPYTEAEKISADIPQEDTITSTWEEQYLKSLIIAVVLAVIIILIILVVWGKSHE